MRTETYWIGGVGGTAAGRLGVAPRPRGGEWLEEEVGGWRRAGVDAVVSLLTPDEVAELQLGNEPELCKRTGIAFQSLPIPDRGVPQSTSALSEVAEAVANDVLAGRSVLVHCRQGIGRSALLAASVLVLLGHDPESALTRIELARGRPVPDTSEQRDWVRRYSAPAPGLTRSRAHLAGPAPA